MKLKIILMVSLLSIFMTGCSKLKENTLVEEGEIALEEHNYQKAKELLSDSLEIDSEDEYARAMYVQASKMQSMNEYKEQGNYTKAIKELELIENIKNGLSSIKNEASIKKKELIKLNEEHLNAKEQRKENAKLASSKDKYRIEQQAIKEQQKQLSYLEEKKKQEEEAKKKEEENNKTQNQQEEGVGNQDIVVSPQISQQASM